MLDPLLLRTRMKKLQISLLALLLCCAGSALPRSSKWTLRGKTSVASIYFDEAGVRRSGSIARLWTRSNYHEPNRNANFSQPALSAVTQVLVNCVTEQWALSFISYYTLPDGNGSVVWTRTIPPDQHDWTPSVPDTIAAEYVAAACNAN
jgi:hypothetical protein